MTELEKIAYARSFIDKLANGINPLDDTPIPDGDIVNNVRLSRCFFYVSDILRQVLENGGTKKIARASLEKFSLPPEQREKFDYSIEPITVSMISRRLNALIDTRTTRKLSCVLINQWLLEIGMLTLREFGGRRPVKYPTEAGEQIGITVEMRDGRYGPYPLILFTVEAQRFIVDNLDAVLDMFWDKRGKKSVASEESDEE